MPTRRSLARIAWTCAGSSSTTSRSLSIAGRPASSWMTWPSAAVIVSSGPNGAAPCETHGSISTPSSRTPTAPPPSSGSPSMNSAGSPSRRRALATPPMTGTPRACSLSVSSTPSVGYENGSGSITTPAAPSSVGSPLTASPSSISSTVEWNGVASPSPSDAAQTAIPAPVSISCEPASTPPAPQPMSTSGSSASRTPSSESSGSARCTPAVKTIARSACGRSRPARASAAASIAAVRGSARIERPEPMRTPTPPHYPGMEGVLALFGPTGVGKTAVALALAERLRAHGEDPVAISVDALQVYAGLETLTGAATAEENARLEHRLVGFLPVGETSSVAEHARRAHAEIDRALAAGRAPMVVGGTGLYLRAALAELDLKPAPPPELRARLSECLQREGSAALHSELRSPVRERIDPRDAHRVVRALELQELGETHGDHASDQLWTSRTRHPTRLVALVMEREALYARIDERVDAMVAAGAAEEVRAADAAGASVTARQALGFADLLAGDVEAMKRRTRQYARRQLTWLRKLPGVELVDVTGREAADVAHDLLQ